MRISCAKAEAIVNSTSDWISFADNDHRSIWWNTVTGEILWIADAGWANLSKPTLKKG